MVCSTVVTLSFAVGGISTIGQVCSYCAHGIICLLLVACPPLVRSGLWLLCSWYHLLALGGMSTIGQIRPVVIVLMVSSACSWWHFHHWSDQDCNNCAHGIVLLALGGISTIGQIRTVVIVLMASSACSWWHVHHWSDQDCGYCAHGIVLLALGGISTIGQIRTVVIVLME